MLSIIKELKPKLAKFNIAILVISIFVLISSFSYFVFLMALTNYKKSTTPSNAVISLLDLSVLMSQWWLVTLILIFGILNVICIVFMLDIRKSIFALNKLGHKIWTTSYFVFFILRSDYETTK
ncbi:hypothetical protein ACNF36_02005, partial [Mycoplasma sp. 4463]|uniref:hypothetical protein n=1 Tax=Mycoplasma sp. 4463 TaxID=3400998 RepID=UPI003AAE14F8